MTEREKITAAQKKLRGNFPTYLRCFYYKGLRITKDMFFSRGE